MDAAKKKKPAQDAKVAPDAKAPAALGEGLIRCRRVDAVYSATEHKNCPYCYGREADIATGDHTKFCDFKPGEDPICFGFPADHGRYRSK